MYDYVVGTEEMHRFRVAKFGMGQVPIEVYTVGWYGSTHFTCSCPGGMHPSCKHRKMVGLYIDHAFPIMNTFWEEKGEIRGCYAQVTAEWKRELEGVTNIRGGFPSVGGGKKGGRKIRSAKRR